MKWWLNFTQIITKIRTAFFFHEEFVANFYYCFIILLFNFFLIGWLGQSHKNVYQNYNDRGNNVAKSCNLNFKFAQMNQQQQQHFEIILKSKQKPFAQI